MSEQRTTHTTSHRHASPAGVDRSRWLALAVVLAGAFVILLDATIVNVAVPSIQQSLRASYGAIEWAVSGYALAYGLLLVPAGRLADRYEAISTRSAWRWCRRRCCCSPTRWSRAATPVGRRGPS